MRTTMIRALGLVIALGLPAALQAQRSGGIPFRAAQWGAEFSASDDFQGLGVIRFFSPRRALAFDARFSNVSSEVEGSEAGQSTTTYGLSAGYRMYRSVTSGVVGYATGGAMISSISTTTTAAGGAETENKGSGYGPFLEVGASYFVTSHLSLGAAYGVRYLITSGTQGATETSGHDFGMSPLSVRVSLFF